MKTLVTNRRARYEYEILDTYMAGIVLTGPEVKALRQKQGSLAGSHVRVVGNEIFLINAQIPPYSYARQENYDTTQTRKLLLKKNEVQKLQQIQQQKGRTLVPLAFGLEGKFIKLKFAVGKGKAQHDKREAIKKRDLNRQAAKEIKYQNY